jgi:transglutaminase-like putative cysteine protease
MSLARSTPGLAGIAIAALLLCVCRASAENAGGAAGEDAGGAFDPWNQAAQYELEYRADLTDLPAGDERRVWIPMPAQTPIQRVLSYQVDSPWTYEITEDSYGNRFIYLEAHAAAPSAQVVARYTVERSPAKVGLAGSADGVGRRDDPKRFLAAARRIPLDGVIEKIAARQTKEYTTKPQKIRALYDYVYDTMSYSKVGDGWGQGDAVWACTKKYGNCTDFHSLFIGMARSQGIPARFHIGFPIDPTKSAGERAGYHCWAEVHQEDSGWIPIDASDAKKAGRRDDYFGFLPSDRVEFTVGRDLVLEPAQAGDPINYFIYPYAEVDRQVIPQLPARLIFRRL